jgi:hypothetical protein
MKYRKKPVVIEAVTWDGIYPIDIDKYPYWYCMAFARGILKCSKSNTLLIKTLEREMTATLGDKIIQGVNQEIYACKPDIFEKTYDVAEGE